MLKRFVGVLALVATLSPVSVFAATPQMTLNTALDKLVKQEAVNLNGSLALTLNIRPVGKATDGGSFALGVGFTNRVDRQLNSTRDGEGSVTVDRLSSQFTGVLGLQNYQLTEPIKVEWKAANKVAYIRLSQAPSSLMDMLKAEGIDLTGILGKWFSIDMAELAPALDNQSSELNALKRPRAFAVTRVEKREKIDGHDILRVRARILSSALWTLQREELAKVNRKDPFAKYDIQAINARYTDLRKRLLPAQFVFVVDATSGDLKRIEMGVNLTEPQKTCSYNKLGNPYNCKVISITTTHVLAGVNILPEATMPVIAPAGAQDLKAYLEEMMQSRYGTSTTDIPMEMGSSTVSAP